MSPASGNEKAESGRILRRALLAVLVSAGFSNILYAQGENTPSKAYAVLPGDVLQISVWKEPELQMEVLVRPDSAFSFPLAGDISTDGLSVVDLQAELTKERTNDRLAATPWSGNE